MDQIKSKHKENAKSSSNSASISGINQEINSKAANTRTIIATELQTKKNVQVVLNETQQAKLAEYLSRKISGLGTIPKDALNSKSNSPGCEGREGNTSPDISCCELIDDEADSKGDSLSSNNSEAGKSVQFQFSISDEDLSTAMLKEQSMKSDSLTRKSLVKLKNEGESTPANILKSTDSSCNNQGYNVADDSNFKGSGDKPSSDLDESCLAKNSYGNVNETEKEDSFLQNIGSYSESLLKTVPKEVFKETSTFKNSPSFKTDILSLRKYVLKRKCKEMNERSEFYKKLLKELFYLKSGKTVEYFSDARNQALDGLLNFLDRNKIDSDSLNLFVSECSSDFLSVNDPMDTTESVVIEDNGELPSQLNSESSVLTKSPTVGGKLKSLKPLLSKKPAVRNISNAQSSPIFKTNIMEKARQEAYVIQRVAELRKQGLWVEKRLPKVAEPSRLKAHWDYLLEEMVWLSVDFSQERKWKKSAAKKCSRMVQKYFQNKANAAVKAEKEQKQKLIKTASFMAKEVRMFWSNVEKLVEYKQQARLERKRKKAFDMHLNFIVSQTEKYSSWLAEGMTKRSDKDKEDPEDKEISRRRTRQSIKDATDSKDSSFGKLNSDVNAHTDAQIDQPLTIHDFVRVVDSDEADDSDYSPTSESDISSVTEEDEVVDDKVEAVTELMDIEADKDLPISKVIKKYSKVGFYPDASEDSSSDNESAEECEEVIEADDIHKPKKEDFEPNFELSDGESSDDKSLKFDDDSSSFVEGFQPKGNTLSTAEVVTKVPFLLRNKLREYQHIGLDWLVALYDKKLNGILADEMGLGKTIQTIALLAHLACEKENWGPHLVIVPTSVIVNWEIEFKKWCPAFKILTYYGSVKDRKQKRVGWTKPNAFHICITSYKLVIQDHGAFRRKKWNYMILDEAQNIKNFKSQRWQLLLNFQTERRLLLTGTPLQNDLMELWSLMHFLMPNIFQSHAEFKEWFSNPLTGIVEGSYEYSSTIVRRLHKVLRPFILRRLKSEVEKQLPKKIEHVMLCRLSNRQRFLYDDFMSRARTKETLSSGNLLSVINVLMQLRKVCNHPDLFDPRPTVSSFVCVPITYCTASLAITALEYDPWKHIDLRSLNLIFPIMEKYIQASEAHMLARLRPPENFDADIYTTLPPACPRGKVKLSVQFLGKSITWNRLQDYQDTTNPKMNESIRLLQSISNYRLVVKHQGVVRTVTLGQLLQAHQSNNGHPISPNPVTLHVKKTVPPSVILPPHMFGSSLREEANAGIMPPPSSNKIPRTKPQPKVTVVRAGKIRLGPARFKPNPPCSLELPETINFGFTSMGLTYKSDEKLNKLPGRPGNELSCRLMRGGRRISKFRSIFGQHKKKIVDSSHHKKKMKLLNLKLTEYMKLYKVKCEIECDKSFLAQLNLRRCQQCPVYGMELRKACCVVKQLGQIGHENVISERGNTWKETSVLSDMVFTPESLITKLQGLLQRYLIYVPAVSAFPVSLHASHLPPSYNIRWHYAEDRMLNGINKKLDMIHPILSAHKTQFPDLRLIQYDCGKLQLLDKLLKQLGCEGHRVLIFTQMTRMLDILEMFLNYHGYRYLRLDGTTRVERRQTLMERFNSDPRIFCFILSTRSGGVGVNLTGADTVIFYDSDWNPTMDAQAQDRCHRIGQTRNVHIYRLISEKTVEENILKKAYQKRLLSDLAIEGGNFTSSHFKKQSLHDIFEVSKDENSETALMEMVAKTQKGNMEAAEKVLEKAFSLAEDETDVNAARLVQAEVEADFAEFDENSSVCELPELLSKKEKKVMQLVEQLTNIERYAMRFVESDAHNFTVEKIAQAEAELEQQKREWEMERINALKEEEARVKEAEEEEQLTYASEDASNQVWVCYNNMEVMPIWAPPTPPMDASDVYVDYSLGFLYDSQVIPESQLPTVYFKKDTTKRLKLDVNSQSTLSSVHSSHSNTHITDSKAVHHVKSSKMRKEDSLYAPRSLFDRPSPAVIKMRRDAKLQKYRGIVRASLTLPNMKSTMPYRPSDTENVPDWFIHEDWTLLQSIQSLQELPLNLVILSPGHTPNWDMVADMVNSGSRHYRSGKQCKNRYESVLIAREEGKVLYDPSPRKMKKNKTWCKYSSQDNNFSFTNLFHQRFEIIKHVANKRTPTTKPTLLNTTVKNPKHFAVLGDSGINYETPLTPIQVAANRMERIRKEREKQHLAAEVALQQRMQAKLHNSGMTTQPSLTTSSSNILNTTVVSSSPITSASTSSLATALRATQRGSTTLSFQDVRSQPNATVVSLGLNPVQVQGARITTAGGLTAITQSKGTPTQTFVSPNSCPKTLTPAQVHYLKQQAFLRKKQQQVQTLTRPVSEMEMAALLRRSQKSNAQGTMQAQVQVPSQSALATAQILAQAGIQIPGSGQGSQSVATLVKTVTSSSPTVTIPVSSINVAGMTLAQVKTGVSTDSNSQQIRQVAISPQVLAQRKVHQQKLSLAQVSGANPGGVLPQAIFTKAAGAQTLPAQTVAVVTGVSTSQSNPVSAGQTVQARVIPVSATSHSPGLKQTIQVVSASPAIQQAFANSQQKASLISSSASGQALKGASVNAVIQGMSVALKNTSPGPVRFQQTQVLTPCLTSTSSNSSGNVSSGDGTSNEESDFDRHVKQIIESVQQQQLQQQQQQQQQGRKSSYSTRRAGPNN